MKPKLSFLFVLVASELASTWPRAAFAAAPAARQEQFPRREDTELLPVARLLPVAQYSDIVRYTLHRGYAYSVQPTAQIAQVDWAYGDQRPRVTLVEFLRSEGGWRVTNRREAEMHPARFDQLIRNISGAIAVIGDRSSRGTELVCSHSPSSRLDFRLPDQGGLTISRSAHCSDDAPVVVAGELLAKAVELSIRLDRSPE